MIYYCCCFAFRKRFRVVPDGLKIHQRILCDPELLSVGVTVSIFILIITFMFIPQSSLSMPRCHNESHVCLLFSLQILAEIGQAITFVKCCETAIWLVNSKQ